MVSKQLQPISHDKSNIPLHDLIERSIDDKAGSVKLKSIRNNKPTVALFLRIIKEELKKEPMTSDLTSTLIITYRDKLKKTPPKISTSNATKNIKTIDAVIALNLNPISQAQFKKSTNWIKQLLEWGIGENYAIEPSIINPLTNVKKATKAQVLKRQGYSNEQMKTFVLSQNYIDGAWDRSSMYWIPLIAMFLGARRQEILQLQVADIIKVDNVWCYDINEDDIEDKR